MTGEFTVDGSGQRPGGAFGTIPPAPGEVEAQDPFGAGGNSHDINDDVLADIAQRAAAEKVPSADDPVSLVLQDPAPEPAEPAGGGAGTTTLGGGDGGPDPRKQKLIRWTLLFLCILFGLFYGWMNQPKDERTAAIPDEPPAPALENDRMVAPDGSVVDEKAAERMIDEQFNRASAATPAEAPGPDLSPAAAESPAQIPTPEAAPEPIAPAPVEPILTPVPPAESVQMSPPPAPAPAEPAVAPAKAVEPVDVTVVKPSAKKKPRRKPAPVAPPVENATAAFDSPPPAESTAPMHEQPALSGALSLRPDLDVLFIAVSSGCPACTSVARVRFRGQERVLAAGDSFLRFRVEIRGDRLILRNDAEQHTFLPIQL